MKQQDDIKDAFDLLLDYLKEYQDEIANKSVEAIKNNNLDLAQDALNKAQKINEFRNRIIELKNEWKRLSDGGFISPRKRLKSDRNKASRTRMRKGLITPRENFIVPILKAIVELGGSAEPKNVVDLVGEIMKEELNEFDKLINSKKKVQKWVETVHWTRLYLVKEGLLSKNSQHGVWEISNKGREFLLTYEGQNQPKAISQ